MPRIAESGSRALIVGAGALGGVIAARLRASGAPVWLATRTAESAARLRASGLRVSGVGGAVSVGIEEVFALGDLGGAGGFDLLVLATKAHDAIAAAPGLPGLLAPGGVLVPIQNGSVAQLLGDVLGECVLGGLSNLGATMAAPGVYEQRNAGHLLVGELAGGVGGRAERVARWLGRAIEVRVTPNIRGAVWSKLLLNCSVTTIGAVAGRTMREYLAWPAGRELFDRAYGEALSVALASGARPERMLVEPIPPGWNGHAVLPGPEQDAWLGEILAGYGDALPSMLQDFRRGRTTEIEFLNGYVARLGEQLGIRTPANAAIVETVSAITRGELAPDPGLLERLVRASR